MRKVFVLLAFSFLSGLTVQAQLNTWLVKFKDKGSNPFSISDPSQYLSQRALDRRSRYGIEIDSMDLPVTPRYIDSLRAAGNVSILTASKWLNQVAIRTTDGDALTHILSMPFVLSVEGIAPKFPQVTHHKDPLPQINIQEEFHREQNVNGYYNYGKSNGQVALHNGQFLHNHGFRGKTMQMAVLDAGFFHYQTLPTIDTIRMNTQILGTWDFVANEASVNEDNSHGMQCLSAIAANIPGTFVGTAPETNFYLFRTEDVNSEYPIEEQNLAAGWERSDSLGVDICSVSLGYSTFDNSSLNYSYADMDGNTTISAKAADIAAAKGMLIVVALGNEGNNAWHFLSTPSDADSVLAVGAVDTTGAVGSFSSYGPASDGRVKPDVSATGVYAVVANSSNGLPSYGFGTSFACPNMAGITTCLWQAFPEVSNMTIIETLRRSSNQFDTPYDRRGYGIPDAMQAFTRLQKAGYQKQTSLENCNWKLALDIKTDPTMHLILQRKNASDQLFTDVSDLTNADSWGFHHFDFSDDVSNFLGANLTYRLLMQIGTDTTYTLDSILVQIPSAACSTTINPDVLLVLPNPVHGDATVQISSTSNTHAIVVLYNAIGQRVFAKDSQVSTGLNTWIIPMTKLPSGTYVVYVYVNNERKFVRKIIKE